MKQRVYADSCCSFLPARLRLYGSALLLVAGTAIITPTALAAGGNRLQSVVGSAITAATPNTINPGVSTNVCFTAHIVSPDVEYTDRIDVDLPDDWTVGSVSVDSTPPANGCSTSTPPVSGVGADNLVYWQTKGTMPSSCGAWDGGSGGRDFVVCAEVTAPNCSGAPWNLAWNIIGDGWESAPHSTNGTVTLACGAASPTPNIDVDPLTMSSTQATNTTTSQTLTIANTGDANLDWTIDEEPAPRPLAAPKGGSITKLRAPTPVQRSEQELHALQKANLAQIVQDGGFEAGTPSPFWTEYSSTFGTVVCDTGGCGTGGGSSYPRSGNWWAWFGGVAAYEEGSVSQSVTIPSGGPATLTFHVMNGACSGDANDYLEVTMDGTQLWQTTGDATECGTTTYRQVTVDVSAYADGIARTLEFHAEIFGSNTTNFALDDVVLNSADGPVVCASPADVPWLLLDSYSGSTAGGAHADVTVMFDSTGLVAGTYTANLCVSSNDPDTGPGNGTSLVVVPVQMNVTVPATHAITPSVGTLSGTISPSTPQTVADGGTATFTLAPSLGFHIDGVDGTCGGTLTGASYVTDPVTDDCTVVAHFAADDIPVTTVVPGGHGSVSGPATVPYGNPASFTITPDAGYVIDSVSGCGGTLSGNTYTVPAVTGTCTITASFRLLASPTPQLVPVSSWQMLLMLMGLVMGGAWISLRRS